MSKPFKVLVCLMILFAVATREAFCREASFRESVVKIYITLQRPDYLTPWQSLPPNSGSGSGFIIDKKRILTNAHVVSDVRFLQVQKDGDAKRYPAKVLYIAHDCDLAILSLDEDEEAFFEGTRPMRFSAELPKPDNEVTVIGYPTGGTRLSVTRGVVSRIDYSTYSHSFVDQHLVIQVDAAINPGNSGGPILFNGKVVGLAFQGLMAAENIGYGIPIPVINHFLEDIADGTYHGYPELGAATLETTNPGLSKDLAMPASMSGVVVYYLDPFGSAVGRLQLRDVLLSIDGHDIAKDGTVMLGGNNVQFAELLERKQCGQSVLFEVLRNGSRTRVTVPLKSPDDPFIYRNLYDDLPQYLLCGGLVFSPLNREYLKTLGRAGFDSNSQQLLYYSQYAKIDGLNKDRDEFVVLIRRLPHPVNTYSDEFINGIVNDVNGTPIRNIADIRKALESPKKGFHVFRFAGMESTLVVDAEAAARADRQILLRYGVSSPEHIEKKK